MPALVLLLLGLISLASAAPRPPAHAMSAGDDDPASVEGVLHEMGNANCKFMSTAAKRVENGKLDFQNVGAAQPIICDGYSALGNAAGPLSGLPGAASDGGNPGVVVAVIFLIIAILAGLACYCKRKQEPPPPPPPKWQGGQKAIELPPGWVGMDDPATGHRYCARGGATNPRPTRTCARHSVSR